MKENLLAFGAMLGLRELGLEPGLDCSIVGIDDSAEAALWVPALTTVSIDTEGIGRGAVPLFAQRIANPDAPVRRMIITPRLVVRESCCAPKAKVRRQPARSRAANTC